MSSLLKGGTTETYSCTRLPKIRPSIRRVDKGEIRPPGRHEEKEGRENRVWLVFGQGGPFNRGSGLVRKLVSPR